MLSSGSNNRFLWLLLLISFLSNYTKTFGGFSCVSNPCIHGICIDDLNTTYSCYCIDGYTGVQCQTNWDECWSNPCQNGGICHDGIAEYNCSCLPGFVGESCEENYNECESNPCLYNGTCVDGTNGYNCLCPAGYSGVHCEIDVAVCNSTNETRCNNGGICEEGPGVTFTCNCKAGWGGYLCESEIDECISSPCQNGAICIDLHDDYSCACLFGYTGKNCDEVILRCNESHCKNGALCLMEESHPICYCVPDYHGDRCQFQYDECQLGPKCMNGGTCIDGIDSFTCSCPPNLTGVFCECLIISKNEIDCMYTVPPITQVSLLTEPSQTISEVTDKFTTSKVPINTTLETSSFTDFTTEVSIISSESDSSSTVILPNTTTSASVSSSTISESSLSDGTTITAIFVENQTEYLLTTTELSTKITEQNVTTLFSTTTEDGSPSSTMSVTESTIMSSTVEFGSTSTIEIELTTISVESTIDVQTTTAAVGSTSTEVESTSRRFESTSMGVESTSREVEATESTSTATSLEPTSTDAVFTLETSSESIETLYSTSTEIQEYTTSSSIDHTPPPSFPTILTSSETPFTIVTGESTVSTILSSSEASTITVFTTTSSRENSTRSIDCSVNVCQNGGTCVYTEDGYMCLCPHDAEGPMCEMKLGIKKAAFSGDSYLAHRLLSTRESEVEFKTQTLSPNGLIFYSNIDKSYMALYLEKGYLKFIFSCGYQTMLLSELKNLVNQGFELKVKTFLQFSKDLKHCKASLMINNTLTMSGQQTAVVNPIIKPQSYLYLGGVPQEMLKPHIPMLGFIGCITNLKISGKDVNVFKDAETGYKISECSSLACLSNPCNNEGACMEKDEKFYCNCKNGYLGEFCEHSVCDNNPCLFGATCLPFTGNGYICLCPFGKHGHYCENDLEIIEPHFSSSIHGFSSYAAYAIPAGGISNNMELKFKFSPTTMDQISILIFIGQSGLHDAFSDHLAVSFVKGYIMLTWNLGSGPRRIFTPKPIAKNKNSYLIHLGRMGRRAWLSVDNIGNVTGRSPGNLVQMDVVPIIFLGGHSSPNFSILPHDLPLHSGFSGCIYDVELKSGNLIIPLQSSRQVVGRSLGQCNTNECHENLCQNEGACLHHGATFTCLCQDGWYGPLCSSKYNPCDHIRNNCSAGSKCVPLLIGYECDCPAGRIGTFCEKEDNLSDVSLSGKRSYIIVKPFDFQSAKFSIELQIRPLSDRGLILFIGKEDASFLSLNMQSGLLELRILLAKRNMIGNEVISIRSNKLLAIGLWFKITIRKFGNKVHLSVDDMVNTIFLRNGDHINFSEEDIHLGGLPDMSKLPNKAVASTPTPFTGCIRQLTINFRHIPLTKGFMKDGQNIEDCDGTPCGGDSCENGGTCWLDSNLNPHCSCVEPYMGGKCEIIQSCNEMPCKNQGNCVNGKCSCLVGYKGAFCESSITVTIPEFYGNSHLIIKKSHADKKRDSTNALLKKLYLKFATVEENGLILWSSKMNNFIGIGIENGYLKLAHSLTSSNKTVTQIVPFKSVTDGFWHTLELSIISMHLQVHLDKRLLTHNHLDTITVNDLISTNDDFYLGGLPHNYSILEHTKKLFLQPFSGCIEMVRLNDEKIIADFSVLEGQNIGICKI